MATETHEIAEALLRDAGFRYTSNRRAIVEALANAGGPLTIPQLLRQKRGLIQSSAYRAVEELEGAGVITRVATGEERGRFELSEDLAGHHHHLICRNCGTVEDFHASYPLERRLKEAIAGVARARGFTAEAHRLDIVGLCEDCG